MSNGQTIALLGVQFSQPNIPWPAWKKLWFSSNVLLSPLLLIFRRTLKKYRFKIKLILLVREIVIYNFCIIHWRKQKIQLFYVSSMPRYSFKTAIVWQFSISNNFRDHNVYILNLNALCIIYRAIQKLDIILGFDWLCTLEKKLINDLYPVLKFYWDIMRKN